MCFNTDDMKFKMASSRRLLFRSDGERGIECIKRRDRHGLKDKKSKSDSQMEEQTE